MTTAAQATKTGISRDGQTATVSIPVTFLQRGGRKQILSPPGATCVYRESKSERIDDEVRPVWRANL